MSMKRKRDPEVFHKVDRGGQVMRVSEAYMTDEEWSEVLNWSERGRPKERALSQRGDSRNISDLEDALYCLQDQASDLVIPVSIRAAADTYKDWYYDYSIVHPFAKRCVEGDQLPSWFALRDIPVEGHRLKIHLDRKLPHRRVVVRWGSAKK